MVRYSVIRLKLQDPRIRENQSFFVQIDSIAFENVHPDGQTIEYDRPYAFFNLHMCKYVKMHFKKKNDFPIDRFWTMDPKRGYNRISATDHYTSPNHASTTKSPSKRIIAKTDLLPTGFKPRKYAFIIAETAPRTATPSRRLVTAP